MVRTYRLRGLAEGLVGQSSVKARSLDGVFKMFPALQKAKDKLVVKGANISGFSACDG